MLAPSHSRPQSRSRLRAATRVKRWTRERFSLGSDSTILVSELESAVPGFPPLQTVVAFRTAERKHYHFRVFKPLAEVAQDDVPPSWYLEALVVTQGAQCNCC